MTWPNVSNSKGIPVFQSKDKAKTNNQSLIQPNAQSRKLNVAIVKAMTGVDITNQLMNDGTGSGWLNNSIPLDYTNGANVNQSIHLENGKIVNEKISIVFNDVGYRGNVGHGGMSEYKP